MLLEEDIKKDKIKKVFSFIAIGVVLVTVIIFTIIFFLPSKENSSDSVDDINNKSSDTQETKDNNKKEDQGKVQTVGIQNKVDNSNEIDQKEIKDINNKNNELKDNTTNNNNDIKEEENEVTSDKDDKKDHVKSFNNNEQSELIQDKDTLIRTNSVPVVKKSDELDDSEPSNNNQNQAQSSYLSNENINSSEQNNIKLDENYRDDIFNEISNINEEQFDTNIEQVSESQYSSTNQLKNKLKSSTLDYNNNASFIQRSKSFIDDNAYNSMSNISFLDSSNNGFKLGKAYNNNIINYYNLINIVCVENKDDVDMNITDDISTNTKVKNSICLLIRVNKDGYINQNYIATIKTKLNNTYKTFARFINFPNDFSKFSFFESIVKSFTIDYVNLALNIFHCNHSEKLTDFEKKFIKYLYHDCKFPCLNTSNGQIRQQIPDIVIDYIRLDSLIQYCYENVDICINKVNDNNVKDKKLKINIHSNFNFEDFKSFNLASNTSLKLREIQFGSIPLINKYSDTNDKLYNFVCDSKNKHISQNSSYDCVYLKSKILLNFDNIKYDKKENSFKLDNSKKEDNIMKSLVQCLNDNSCQNETILIILSNSCFSISNQDITKDGYIKDLYPKYIEFISNKNEKNYGNIKFNKCDYYTFIYDDTEKLIFMVFDDCYYPYYKNNIKSIWKGKIYSYINNK